MSRRPRLPALAGTLALALTGCATTRAPSAPRIVRVPVPVACAVRIPLAPRLPLQKVGPRSTDAEVARAYVASIIVLRGYARSLSGLLVACVYPSLPSPHDLPPHP